MASSAGSRGHGGPAKAPSPGSLIVPGNGKKSKHGPGATPGGGSNVVYGGKPDPSVLRPSISVATTGMKQAVKVLETGTQEVRKRVSVIKVLERKLW